MTAPKETGRNPDGMGSVDLDLGRFFDTVSHSKPIEIPNRTVKDGRVVSLIHKYPRSGVTDKGLWHASGEALRKEALRVLF